ncbi:unnamed protein product [Linum tenue]|uniref:tRNA-uridine aminocarboxypropyltransferase n=1 Tax=Linum tenue TaxID=586396 RepID=A0AAV0QX64_9ROSI|nr:unnamed protein product [Linum tenue]
MLPAAANKPFSHFKHFLHPPSLAFYATVISSMDSPPRFLQPTLSNSAARSPPRLSDIGDGSITLQEWQRWGPVSPIPSKVLEVIDELKLLEKNVDTQMSFGGSGGKLKGDFRTHEEKKHRATYLALDDPESKIHFYAARQIACRLLGSRGYLCQKEFNWFAVLASLGRRLHVFTTEAMYIVAWDTILDIYASKGGFDHRTNFVQDFLRQNNTGKLLWQIFGPHSATLCIFGISEHEEIMWNAFKSAGKSKVWCLYPNKNSVTTSVQEAFGQESSANQDITPNLTNADEALNFLLIDGTWSNSAAMFRRLKEQSQSVWGEDLPCISLATGVSTMHKLRPQPSWDRTCTAAAAAGLLFELQELVGFSCFGLEKQGEALEDAVSLLLDALTTRRLRMADALEANNRTDHPGRSTLQQDQKDVNPIEAIVNKARKQQDRSHFSVVRLKIDPIFFTIHHKLSFFLCVWVLKACNKVNFDAISYKPLREECKPPYPVGQCCDALKKQACPYTDAINDDKTVCALDLFWNINKWYPAGWFLHHCKEGPHGIRCGPDDYKHKTSAAAPSPKSDDATGSGSDKKGSDHKN